MASSPRLYLLGRTIAASLLCFGAAISLAQKSGPTFIVEQRELAAQPSLIVYGDTRFTDPTNTDATNPRARVALVQKIAAEHPDAVQITGDVPWHGGTKGDYAQYAAEAAPWRTAKLRVYPALGNHEFAPKELTEADALENWWTAFPEERGMRWYSVALGKRVYLLQLDSTSALTPGSPQRNWLEDQVAHLDPAVDFVFVALHHPPVADIQTHIEVDHNPRPNEISLRDYLNGVAPATHARFIVTAGHIHNYERFEQSGVVYLVSGGGGAHPYFVERTKDDLYLDPNFPIFHYIKFILSGKQMSATMYKIADPTTEKLDWQAKDSFVITAK